MHKKQVLSGKFEDVIEIDGHYYLLNKKDLICVLPYTISSSGLLDKIGVTKDWNIIEEELVYTLINDYISSDDETDIVSANRILYELIGTNIQDANLWMYLGNLYSNMTSDSPIKIYAVDVTNIEIKTDESVEDKEERKRFKLLDSSKVIQSDDMLFLAAYLRLFQFFYVQSLTNNKENK